MMKELLNESFETLKKGAVIDAVVVGLTRDKVELDVSYKGLGVIDKSEFNEPLEIGQVVSVYVEEIDDGDGNVILSKSKEMLKSAIDNIGKIIKDSVTVQMVVEGVSRGGISGNYNGLYAFLPFSIIDVNPQKSIEFIRQIESRLKDSKKGKVVIDVKIINISNKSQKSVIASRKALIEENRVDKVKISDLKEDTVVKGVVKNITNYGAFIDLGGVDGLLHISDVSWTEVERNLNALYIGQEVEVMIISIFEEENKIGLSLKNIDRSPWERILNENKVGEIIKAKVNNIEKNGFFATILDENGKSKGIDGFVRNSEVAWKQKTPEVREFVTVDSIVDLQIIEIDERKERISLSLKRTKDNVLQDFADKHKACSENGSVHKVSVISSCRYMQNYNYGYKVVTDCGITGFLPPNEISWEMEEVNSEEKSAAMLSDKFDAMLISCDPINEKVIFSTKRLKENPAIKYIDSNKGKTVSGVVIEVTKGNVIVKLGDGVCGVLKTKMRDLEVGKAIKVKVVDIMNNGYASVHVE